MARIFHEIATPIYPSNSKPFWAFAELYGPMGRGKLEVVIYALDDQQVLYYLQDKIDFAGRLSPVYLKLNMGYCRFPRTGEYEMMVWIDGDIVAQRKFVVSEGGLQ